MFFNKKPAKSKSSRKSQASSSRRTNAMDGAFECIICMEVLVNPRMLPCGHSFCSSPKNCLSEALKLHKPPRCASCNYKLPADIREEAVPKNYALSSAIEALETSANESSEVSPTCSKHGKEQEFYCKPCGVLICSMCWKIDHNKSNHDVVFFSSTLESFTEVKTKLVKYKEEAEKLAELLVRSVEQCSELLDEIRTAEKALEDVTSSTTPAEVIKNFEVFRLRLSTSTSKLGCISAKSVTQQINEVHSKLAASSDLTSCEKSFSMLDQRKSLVASKNGTTPKSLSACKIETINIEVNLDIDEKRYKFAVVDANKGKFYLAGISRSIYLYKFDGSKASLENKTEVGYSISGMGLVNDELVLKKDWSIEIEVRDKESLLLLRTVSLQMKKYYLWSKLWSEIAGYGDTMAMIYSCKKCTLSFFRGKNFKLFAQTSFEFAENEYHKICLFNEETLLINRERSLCIVTFNEKEITAKRFITIDGFGSEIILTSVLTHPALPPQQGILLIEPFNEGIFSCKFDGRSVKDGDRISITALPAFKGLKCTLLSASSSPLEMVKIARTMGPDELVFVSLS